jgi:DNA primase
LKAIVMVEGTFDLLSSGLLGYGVALLGTAINDTWASWVKKNFRAVAVWLDPDEAGRAGAVKIGKRLNAWGIPFRVIDHPVDPKNHNPGDFSILDLKKKLEDVK